MHENLRERKYWSFGERKKLFGSIKRSGILPILQSRLNVSCVIVETNLILEFLLVHLKIFLKIEFIQIELQHRHFAENNIPPILVHQYNISGGRSQLSYIDIYIKWKSNISMMEIVFPVLIKTGLYTDEFIGRDLRPRSSIYK